MVIFIISVIGIFSILGLLAIRSSLYSWLFFLSALTFTLQFTGLLPNSVCSLSWLFILVGIIFSIDSLRERLLSDKLVQLITQKAPNLIDVLKEEELVLDYDRGLESDLFRGHVDINSLLNSSNYEFTAKEKMFLNTQVETLCQILDDWKITQDKIRLPSQVWEYLKTHQFFCMNMPIEIGGLGFSLHAVFEVIQKIATHNITAAVTIMVPNSIDLSGLLLNYGTTLQIESYLPKLIAGECIPTLVIPSINNYNNKGVVCYKKYQDQEVLGVCLNWEHDCIALAPLANLLVLSINLYDPHDFLCLNRRELGRNVCLVPANLPNVFNGVKRSVVNQDFLNGPTKGKDVFIPLSFVVGSKDLFGKNWQAMAKSLIMNNDLTCLALSVAMSKLCFKNISAHSVVSTKFGLPIKNYAEIKAKLAKIGGYNYMLDAMRDFLLAAVSTKNCSYVFVTMMKHYVTDISKSIVNDTIDLYGGNITLGIKNHLSMSYQSVFASSKMINIDVLQIISKCHQFFRAELEAIQANDVRLFDHYLFVHLSFALSNFAKLLLHACSNKIFCSNLNNKYYKDVNFFSLLFSCLIELSLLKFNTLLKNNHRLSARLWDIFRHLFMMCAIVKYHNKHQNDPQEAHFVAWSFQVCLYNIQQSIIEFSQNFPNRFLGKLINILIFPFGKKYYMPDDNLDTLISNAITTNSNIRNRILSGCYVAVTDNLEVAFKKIQL